jgi:hypothetical protein
MDDVLVMMGIVVVLLVAGNLVSVSTDRTALIAAECNLFYGSVDPATLPYCIAEMSRRHYLPTRDESVLSTLHPLSDDSRK